MEYQQIDEEEIWVHRHFDAAEKCTALCLNDLTQNEWDGAVSYFFHKINLKKKIEKEKPPFPKCFEIFRVEFGKDLSHISF